MDQIEIQTMIWHMSPYWLDTWYNTDVTHDMNNLKKKIQKIQKKLKKKLKNFKKIQKNVKLTRDTSLTPLTLY